jgi:hypothetical protein
LRNACLMHHVVDGFACIVLYCIVLQFLTGEGLVDVINWTSLLIGGFINFVIPMLLYIVSQSAYHISTPGGMTLGTLKYCCEYMKCTDAGYFGLV